MMKCISNKTVFLLFALVFARTQCDQVDRVNIYCDARSDSYEPPTFKYTLNVGVNKIKDSCPPDLIKRKSIKVSGSLKFLYEDTFKNITNLESINLSKVGLEEIQPGTFNDLLQLRTLYLEGNTLQEIKNGTFVNLRLFGLYCGRSSISVLQSGAFQNVTIAELNLRDNKLTEIRKGVFQNVRVRTLILAENDISRLEPGAFASLQEMYDAGITLELSNNRIESLGSQVFDNEHILYINLVNNSIAILQSGDLNNLPNLSGLYLSRNRIKEVPQGVFNGSKIDFLDLSHNEISVIANGAFEGMTNLRNLMIDHNELKEWDSGWLRGLDIGKPDIGNWFKVSASYNNIEILPAGSFEHVPEGSVVELAHNQIRNIADGAFSGLTSLKYLDLSYNDISEWKTDYLKNVVIRENVNLKGNKISCSYIELDLPELQAQRVLFDKC